MGNTAVRRGRVLHAGREVVRLTWQALGPCHVSNQQQKQKQTWGHVTRKEKGEGSLLQERKKTEAGSYWSTWKWAMHMKEVKVSRPRSVARANSRRSRKGRGLRAGEGERGQQAWACLVPVAWATGSLLRALSWAKLGQDLSQKMGLEPNKNSKK